MEPNRSADQPHRLDLDAGTDLEASTLLVSLASGVSGAISTSRATRQCARTTAPRGAPRLDPRDDQLPVLIAEQKSTCASGSFLDSSLSLMFRVFGSFIETIA